MADALHRPGDYSADIYTEADASPDTLAHLGPLRTLAGAWSGTTGQDVSPKAPGPDISMYTETWTMDVLDSQVNGPQLFYGLRYHQHVLKVGEEPTFHDQIGYLMWEPNEQRVWMTLAIPRVQTAIAVGQVAPDAEEFTLRADAGLTDSGILTNPWLDENFRTSAWEITVRILDADRWTYSQVTTLHIPGQPAPFEHRDSGTLQRTSAASPNPLAISRP